MPLRLMVVTCTTNFNSHSQASRLVLMLLVWHALITSLKSLAWLSENNGVLAGLALCETPLANA